MKYLSLPGALIFLIFSASCLVSDPKATSTQLSIGRGDVVVSSLTNDSIAVFDADGTFKKILYQIPTAADAIGAIAWLEDTSEILVAVDGTPDRIEAISAVTGATRTFYNNVTFFTGTLTSLVQLKTSTDVIATEGATIERFSARGIRESYGAIWPTSAHANSQHLVGLSTGNWLSCSSTAGLRISPDSVTALAAVATATGPAGATASFGCGELSNGKIVVGWNGAAADHVYVYSATLTGGTSILSTAPAILGDPRGIAVGENDEIYVVDGTRNVVVELDASGNHVREFGSSVLQAPRHVLVVPSFRP